jgi:Co/Zn/Cd efflux system component
VLLDRSANAALVEQVRARLEGDGEARVGDLHLWEIGPGRYALIASITTRHPRPVAYYRGLLAGLPRLVHVTIEVDGRAGSLE